MNVESESILLRRMDFFLQYDIEVWLRKEVSLFLLTSNVTFNCFIQCEVFKPGSSLDLCFRVCRPCR